MTARILLVALVGLLLAADSPTDAAKRDLEKLQGEWRLVALEENGEEHLLRDSQVYFRLKGDVFSIRSGDDEFKEAGTLRLDPGKKPPTMDGVWKEGELKEDFKSIYELERDRLKVAYLRVEIDGSGYFAKERPSGFKMKPVDFKKMPHLRVLVLERVKAK
jgi:uncharacterized protein (TIGR03067 family)